MSSTLKTVFTGDSKQLESAYEKISKENAKLREEMEKTSSAHKHAHEEGVDWAEKLGEAIGEQAGELVKMATAYASVEKAIELVNEEIERQIELQAEAAEVSVAQGGYRAELARNLGDKSPEQFQEFLEKMEGLGLTTGATSEDMRAINDAIGMTGGDEERALATVAEALKYVPEGGAALTPIARAIEQARSITKSDDLETNYGLMASIQATSPISTTEDIAQYVFPSVQNLTTQGGSVPEAVAVASALAKGTGDLSGRKSRAGTTSFFEGVQSFFDEDKARERFENQLGHQRSLRAGEKPDETLHADLEAFAKSKGIKNVPKEMRELVKLMTDPDERPELGREFIDSRVAAFRGRAGQTFTERLHALQDDEELRRQFQSVYKADAVSRGATLAILDKSSPIAAQFEETSHAMNAIDLKQAARHQAEVIASDPHVQRMKLKRMIDEANEQYLAAAGTLAEGGILREGLAKTFKNTGMGALESKLESLAFEAQTGLGTHDTFDYVMQQMVQRRHAMRYDHHEAQMVRGEIVTPASDVRTQDPERLAKADLLDRSIQSLELLHEDMEATKQQMARARAPMEKALREIDTVRLQDEQQTLLRRTGGLVGHDINDQLIELAGSDPEQMLGHAPELRQLLAQAKNTQYDLTHRGHFVNGKFDPNAPDRDPNAYDRRQAEELGPTIAMLTKLVQVVERLDEREKHGQEQAERHHQENAAAGRQSQARAAGAKRHGRE